MKNSRTGVTRYVGRMATAPWAVYGATAVALGLVLLSLRNEPRAQEEGEPPAPPMYIPADLTGAFQEIEKQFKERSVKPEVQLIVVVTGDDEFLSFRAGESTSSYTMPRDALPVPDGGALAHDYSEVTFIYKKSPAKWVKCDGPTTSGTLYCTE